MHAVCEINHGMSCVARNRNMRRWDGWHICANMRGSIETGLGGRWAGECFMVLCCCVASEKVLPQPFGGAYCLVVCSIAVLTGTVGY